MALVTEGHFLDTNVEQVGKDVFDDLMPRKGSEDDDDSDDSSGDGPPEMTSVSTECRSIGKKKEAIDREKQASETLTTVAIHPCATTTTHHASAPVLARSAKVSIDRQQASKKQVLRGPKAKLD